MSQIQKADPKARNRAMGLILAGTVMGTAAISAYNRYQADIFFWLESNTEWLADNSGVLFLLGLVMFSPLFALSGYLLIYGRRIVSAGRMPPPGSSVMRDTAIVTGVRAVRRGRVLQLLSLFLLLAGAAIPTIFWYLFDHFVSTC